MPHKSNKEYITFHFSQIGLSSDVALGLIEQQVRCNWWKYHHGTVVQRWSVHRRFPANILTLLWCLKATPQPSLQIPEKIQPKSSQIFVLDEVVERKIEGGQQLG
nr:hypothetical protein Iba_chr06bCG12670 [Ipomoea batatas]